MCPNSDPVYWKRLYSGPRLLTKNKTDHIITLAKNYVPQCHQWFYNHITEYRSIYKDTSMTEQKKMCLLVEFTLNIYLHTEKQIFCEQLKLIYIIFWSVFISCFCYILIPGIGFNCLPNTTWSRLDHYRRIIILLLLKTKVLLLPMLFNLIVTA